VKTEFKTFRLNEFIFQLKRNNTHTLYVQLWKTTSLSKWPSTSLFHDFFIRQSRDRDSKQNIKIPDRSLL